MKFTSTCGDGVRTRIILFKYISFLLLFSGSTSCNWLPRLNHKVLGPSIWYRTVKILFYLLLAVVPYQALFSITYIWQEKQWQLSHTIRSLYVQWLSILSSMCQLYIFSPFC